MLSLDVGPGSASDRSSVSDLLEFTVVPVIEDADAAKVLSQKK